MGYGTKPPVVSSNELVLEAESIYTVIEQISECDVNKYFRIEFESKTTIYAIY